MNTKPKLIDPGFLKKIIKNNKEIAQKSVVNNLFSFSCNGVVHLIKNYSDFIFVILFLFFILYMRYKYNSKYKKNKLLGPSEVHVNYIRNKDIVNDKVYNIKDDIETEDILDDNVLKVIKNEISKIDDDEIELEAHDAFQNFTTFQ